ncbi:MAG: CofH family radical SAM protein, partial [Sphaerospermopsis kisseleviana]
MTNITLNSILERSLLGFNISPSEAVVLLNQTDQESVNTIRETADKLRQKQAGETVTYVINRNINFTNLCEQHCSFCAFRRDDGDTDAYWLDWAQILEKSTDAVRRGATEICMQGGLNPQAQINGKSLPYYIKLVETIKQEFPQLHLHAFSPQEIQFIARVDGISYTHVIEALRDAGVGSMPGTAAEVLDDQVRKVLCPEKIDTATWLEIVSTAHKLGVPTTSTMLSGHIETPEQQIGHLEKLRSLQQTALEKGYPAKITEFILDRK